MNYEIIIPPLVWSGLKNNLVKSRTNGEEVFLYLIVSSFLVGKGVIMLIYRDHVLPSSDDYSVQGRAGLRLSQQQHINVLNKYVSKGLSMVHIHTHPGEEQPHFSSVDDVNEEKYARFIGQYRPKAHFISAVFNESMTLSLWRSWATSGNVKPSYNVLTLEDNPPVNEIIDERFSRQAVFGAEFQSRLSSLSICLIGCGGLGSIFAEQLARLGAGRWTLIDNDIIEKSNLNRLPFASVKDVGRNKVCYVEDLIKRSNGGKSRVIKRAMGIEESAAKKAAAKCSLIVAATDNNYSRVIAQEIASRFAIRLISVATHIHACAGEEPRYYSRISMPPYRPNSWSLVSAKVVNTSKAAEESASEEIRNQLKSQGYLEEVEAPAVFWLNSIGAAFAVRLVHLLQLGHEFPDGVDQVLDLGTPHFMQLKHPDSDCVFSSNSDFGFYGRAQLKL